MMKRTHSVSLVSLTVTLAIFSPTVGRIFGSLAAAASTADSDEEEGDSSPGCVTLSLGRDTSSLTCSNNVVFPACPHQAHSYTDTQTHINRTDISFHLQPTHTHISPETRCVLCLFCVYSLISLAWCMFSFFRVCVCVYVYVCVCISCTFSTPTMSILYSLCLLKR